MCSACKSRGFGLLPGLIQRPDRLERLILIMAMAFSWAISCVAPSHHAQPWVALHLTDILKS